MTHSEFTKMMRDADTIVSIKGQTVTYHKSRDGNLGDVSLTEFIDRALQEEDVKEEKNVH